MSNDEKYGLTLRIVSEVVILTWWLVHFISVLSYNARVHLAVGEKVTFLSALNFISFNNFEGFKLFIIAVLFLITIVSVAIISIRSSYTDLQTEISWLFVIINIIIMAILVIAMANPILFAVFLLGVAGIGVGSLT